MGALMQRLRALDPRFSLRLRTPADASVLFPPHFACNHELRAKTARSFSESDVSSFSGSLEESDEDEACGLRAGDGSESDDGCDSAVGDMVEGLAVHGWNLIWDDGG